MANSLSFYTDEQFPLFIVRQLRNRGVHIVTTQDAGQYGASDEQQLSYATAHGYVLVTQDDDFLRLNAMGHYHTGIVYTHQRTLIRRVVEDLALIAKAMIPEEMIQQVIHVPL